MNIQNNDDSLKTLQEIRGIMERSTRFISLSGWSGVWAGGVALLGAYIANNWLPYAWIINRNDDCIFCDAQKIQLLLLAVSIFLIALAGGLFFTWRKVKKENDQLWNTVSKKLLIQLAIPLFVGAVFCLGFIYYGDTKYLFPACLVFYGLALINGSKYTLSDIKYLGLFELILGCINIFVPGYGLYFWAIGFGILHIVYGIIMWNKYDKRAAN